MKKVALAALALMPSLATAEVPATVEVPATPAALAVPAPEAPEAPAARQLVLAPNAEVVVTPNDTLTTKGKAINAGAKFRLSTVFDVMQDGYVVIPKGTPGEGTISWMTNKGAFGKSGKMEVSFDWLDVGGNRVPLTGNYRQDGEGNTGATVGAVVAVGVFSAFVTGHSASIVNGQQLRAHTAQQLTFTVPENAARVMSGTLVPATVAAPATSVAAATTAPAPAAAPTAAPAAH